MATEEELLAGKLSELVRRRPIAAMAGACAIGAALGGLVMPRVGRLFVAAVVGYVANELWHREARLDIDDLIEKLSADGKGAGTT